MGAWEIFYGDIRDDLILRIVPNPDLISITIAFSVGPWSS